MPRIKFLRIKPKRFLEEVRNKTGLSFQELANICKVHRRSFSDWKYGQCLMPPHVFRKLIKISGLKPPKIKILPDYWNNKDSARKGGLARYKKYGTFLGWTKEASRRGGLKAAETHRKQGSRFFVSKPIFLPKYSSRLAEFIGILLGDGGIALKQIAITLNKIDDRDFILYVKNFIQKLFKVNPSIYRRDREAVANITVSRTKLVQFFVNMGLPVGNKVKHQIDVPSWIKKSEKFTRYCLRGLFDTDGCFYVDKHYYKDKTYYNCAINFTNRSLPVLFFFKTKVKQLGFHPTHNAKFSISLRRENEIIRYFQMIGSSNPKHLNKFKEYFKNKHGEVPKRS